MSGFSQLGDLFEKQGTFLKSIHYKLNRKSMKDVDIYIIADPDTTKEIPTPNLLKPVILNI